jgi:Synergist-CTERM protein sorting domain-containing protein
LTSTTRIQIDGSSSPLYDTSWLSATEVMTLGSAVVGGEQGTIDFDVMTPAVDVATPITQQLALVDDTGATLGTFNLSLTVAPNADPNTSGDGTEPDPTGGMTGPDPGDESMPPASSDSLTAGCSTGNSVGWLALILPALVLRRRRRTRSVR